MAHLSLEVLEAKVPCLLPSRGRALLASEPGTRQFQSFCLVRMGTAQFWNSISKSGTWHLRRVQREARETSPPWEQISRGASTESCNPSPLGEGATLETYQGSQARWCGLRWQGSIQINTESYAGFKGATSFLLLLLPPQQQF